MGTMQAQRMIPVEAQLLAGTDSPTKQAWEPFAPETVGFLDAFSKALRQNALVRTDPEAMTLAFWCRRARLEVLRTRHCGEKSSGSRRLGRGLLFHLAPSNVPMMFAYTWIIGMLAGNAGIVRISGRTLRRDTVRYVLDTIGALLDQPEYAGIRARSSFITYDRSDAVTESILGRCDGRVLWGGDETIRQMRRIPMPAHAVELAFPDRVSLAVISEAALEKMSDEDLRNLIHRFYNDTYVMDQNGCSSPQTVIWLKDGNRDGLDKYKYKAGSDKSRAGSDEYRAGSGGRDDADRGSTDNIREKWWEYLAQEAEADYEMDGFRAARKLEKAALAAMTGTEETQITSIRRYHGNALYVLRLSALPRDLAAYKGGFGLFYETETDAAEEIFRSFSDRIQTVVCVGIEPEDLARPAAQKHSAGVLRFVSPGQALQMDTIWDGTDLIEALSRRITAL